MPQRWDGVKILVLQIMQDLTLLPPGASVFQKHVLLLPLSSYHLRFGFLFALGLYKEGYFQCVSFDGTAVVWS